MILVAAVGIVNILEQTDVARDRLAKPEESLYHGSNVKADEDLASPIFESLAISTKSSAP